MAIYISVAGYEFLVVDDVHGTIASFYDADEAEKFLEEDAALLIAEWEE